jgi:hypothetical protein
LLFFPRERHCGTAVRMGTASAAARISLHIRNPWCGGTPNGGFKRQWGYS